MAESISRLRMNVTALLEREWFWFLGSGNQGDPVWIAQVDAFDFRMFFDQAGEQFFQPF